jgi:KaiC/GvpD/RAD55 family RecA-like ATPase
MTKTKLPALPAEFKRISDIDVPEIMFNPLSTQNPELDSVFSELGGLVPSQVVLVTGNPGSGKTTICSVVGSRIIKTVPEKPVVFLSYEMSDFQLKLQAQKIPAFTDLVISTHEFHAETGGMDRLFAALDSLEPSLIIVDSLQKMASKMPDGPTRGQIVLVEKFTKWAKKSFVPVLLIGHNDKGGNYSGPSFLKHEVDSHLNVWVDPESHERMFSMSKNRFGGNMESYMFRITHDGVFIGSEWWKVVDGRTDEEIMDIVIDFKNDASKDKLNWDKFRETATALMTHLKNKYADQFADKTFVGSTDKVKLTWEGNRAFCAFRTGQINFGRKFFVEKLSGERWRGLGYRSEKPYIRKYVNNREEAAIWAVLHEFQHLFKGYQKHTKTMWKGIEKLAVENPWLWTNPATT